MSTALAGPDAARLFEALEATWPPAGGDLVGPFRLRRGGGGGQRVSAAVWDDGAGPLDPARARDGLAEAEARMADWGQVPLFMLRGDADDALDRILTDLGYRQSDPSLLLTVPVDRLAGRELPPLRAILAAPDLAICREIWADGGVGPARQDVIARAPPPACAILGRLGDMPVGAALVAVDGPIAMVHALHVLPAHRGEGVGRMMLLRAAHWAAARGCSTLALAVVAKNAVARRLFAELGFAQSAGYHYRVAPMRRPLGMS
ncbi:MAG: GNAT family N-acetyltransferase [Pseudomonadota bacterium]